MRGTGDCIPEVAAFARSPVLEVDLRAGRGLGQERLQAYLEPGQTMLGVRAVKVALPTGATGYLLTNLTHGLPLLGQL